MLLHALELRPPLSRIVTAFSGGLFFNMILPSTIGGDVARAYSLFSHTKEASKIVATVILDRLSGFLAVTFIAILSYAFGHSYINSPLIGWIILFIASIFIFISLLLFSRYISEKFCAFLRLLRLKKIEAVWLKIFNALSLFRDKKGVLFRNFLISLLIQGTLVIIFYLIALSLRANTKVIYFFVIVPIIQVISTIPITIGGLGLRDASAVLFFSKVFIPSEIAVSISLISFLFLVIVGVAGGIVYVLTLHTRRL